MGQSDVLVILLNQCNCTPMADACWCMAKPIQYCKVKKSKIKSKSKKKKTRNKQTTIIYSQYFITTLNGV